MPFAKEAEYSRKMLVARGILRLGVEVRGPVGESYLSNFLDSASPLEIGLHPLGGRLGERGLIISVRSCS